MSSALTVKDRKEKINIINDKLIINTTNKHKKVNKDHDLNRIEKIRCIENNLRYVTDEDIIEIGTLIANDEEIPKESIANANSEINDDTTAENNYITPNYEDKKPNIITINDIQYYNASELQKYNPIFFHGCARTVRKIIQLKEISEEQYVYANCSIKRGWELSKNQNNPPPKANLLLSKDWVNDNIPIMENEIMDDKKTKSIKKNISNNDYLKAPEILVLSDHEKFRDDNGNVIDIEIRGEKTHNKIYFKVIDVSKYLVMPNLVHTLSHKDGNYIRDVHYKTFFVPRNTHGFIKLLFLTLKGLNRVFSVSRSFSTIKNEMIISNWVSKVLPKYTKDIIIDVNIDTENCIGVVYTVSSDLMHGVKIGYWTKSLATLRSRYVMYYGLSVDIFIKYTLSPKKFENVIHKHFKKYNISGELFKKEYSDKYKKFISNHELAICDEDGEKLLMTKKSLHCDVVNDSDSGYCTNDEENTLDSYKKNITKIKIVKKINI